MRRLAADGGEVSEDSSRLSGTRATTVHPPTHGTSYATGQTFYNRHNPVYYCWEEVILKFTLCFSLVELVKDSVKVFGSLRRAGNL